MSGCRFILAFSMYALFKKTQLVTAPMSPNLQAETFTKSAHGTYVRHTNVISPSRSDSLKTSAVLQFVKNGQLQKTDSSNFLSKQNTD